MTFNRYGAYQAQWWKPRVKWKTYESFLPAFEAEHSPSDPWNWYLQVYRKRGYAQRRPIIKDGVELGFQNVGIQLHAWRKCRKQELKRRRREEENRLARRAKDIDKTIPEYQDLWDLACDAVKDDRCNYGLREAMLEDMRRVEPNRDPHWREAEQGPWCPLRLGLATNVRIDLDR